jgi:formylglycine-generating enzyme required for sulfatase activity
MQTYATVDGAEPIAGIDSYFGDRTSPFHGPWAVGSGTEELNGTYDMMGNVGELSESTMGGTYTITHAQDLRLVRGGSWITGGTDILGLYYRYGIMPYAESDEYGFRVASVPEPCTVLLLGLGGAMLRKKAKRKG